MRVRLNIEVTPMMTGEETIAAIKEKYQGIKIDIDLNKKIFKYMTYIIKQVIIKQVSTGSDKVFIYFYANYECTDHPFLIADGFDVILGTSGGVVFLLNGQYYTVKHSFDGTHEIVDSFIINICCGNIPDYLRPFGRIRNITKNNTTINVYFVNGAVLHIPLDFVK